MSLSSLNAELSRLTQEKKDLVNYKDKIQGLGRVLDNIKTLDIALKIDNYYKIDDSATDKVAKVKTSIGELGSSLMGDTRISSAIEVKDREISSKRSEIAQEEARIAAEEARRRAEEEAKAREQEAEKSSSSSKPSSSNPRGPRSVMVE